MSITFEKVVADDLNIGVGPVSVTNPNGGTMASTKISLSTLGGPLVSSHYDFTPQSPGVSLSAGVGASVTLAPVPVGVNGSDVGHYLYLSSGYGTAEAVLITGGSAVSGGTTGTITFTPAYSHSGSWTISSATGGVQEALICGLASSSVVLKISGSMTFYAGVTIPLVTVYRSVVIQGDGISGTTINRSSSSPSGYLFTIDQSSGTPASCTFRDFGIFSAPYVGSFENTSGGAFKFKKCTSFQHTIDHVSIMNPYNGIEIDSSFSIRLLNFYIGWTTYYLNNYSPHCGVIINTTSGGSKPSGIFMSDGYIYGDLSASNKVTSAIIMNSADGILIENCYIGQTDYGMTIYPGGNSFVDDVYISNSIFDGFNSAAVSLNGGANSLVTQFRIANSHLCNWSAASPPSPGKHIINVIGSVVRDFQIVGCNIFGAPASGIFVYQGTLLEGGLIANNQIWGYDIDNNYGAGICLQSGVKNVSIIGNQIGNELTNCSWATQRYGILLSGSASSNLIVKDNSLIGNVIPILVDTAYPTTSIISDNLGVDEIIGTVISGSSITLPFNSVIKVSESNQILYMLGGWTGRKVRLIFTNANPGGFAAGGNIIRAITVVQYVPVDLIFDGTYWY
jgi:hypothetical protein